jgi:TolB-like protein/DNA-binding winged helix-turn-helix (wHTH) protein
VPQASRTDAIVRFGEFAVDPAQATLRRNGLTVALQDKPLQLLLALLERPGQLITREELCNRLWPEDDFGAFEIGLNTAIRKLRIALNDSPETPQFIETVPRRGYRFIAPVETVTSSTNGTAPTSSPAPVLEPGAEVKPISGTRWWKVSLAVAVLALVATGIWMAQRRLTRGQTEPTQPRITSLAVLPLTNMTGDNKQEYFVDGMTDELTTSLAQISGLRVTSETSSRRYRGTNKSAPEIARELGVDGLVEGAVARSGDKVRITAQLISARDDRHLWAESFERNATDALGLQHEVARAIADRIHVTLTPAEAHRLETLPTRNPAAYDVYLRARYLGASGLMVKADNEQSIAAAEEAVALDPGFAQAYAAVAYAHTQRIFSWAGGKDDDEKAIVALDKAIALNPNLAEAYVVRGNLYYNHLRGFDIVNSVANFKKAIALNPNYADARHWLGAELTHAGLHDRAIEEYRTALALDPLNDPAKYRLSRAFWQSQRFEESLQNYERYNIKAIEEALPLVYLGRRQQAWDLVAELTPQAGGGFRSHDDFPAVRALLDAMDGNAARAEREIQESVRLGKTDDHFHHAAFIIAAAYAEMGKPHEAVQWLHRVSETGMPNYPLFHDNPSMKKLYGNPEYEQFMTEFKPRWEQFAQSLIR